MCYQTFISYLKDEDKPGAVTYINGLLDRGEISVLDLYTQILIPSLNEMEGELKTDEGAFIWQEHFRTSVVRTIIELCYPRIINKGSAKKGKKVLVFCPEEEYHELGARVIADYFTWLGCDTYYLGGNTPKEALMESLRYLKPQMVAMGVNNYFNVVAAKDTVEEIRRELKTNVKIVVGGSAFKNNEGLFEKIGGDFLANSFLDIKNFLEGCEKDETGI